MKFFEVFKAGNYPQGTFSEQDVEALASNYDPKFCEAPITLDHEQKGPAYGWVEKLLAENGKLKACFRDVSPELKDLVQSGKYKKISVEIYKEIEGRKPYLKSISFLGAGIPQVKGMEPVAFKEGESETYIFEIEETEIQTETANITTKELVKHWTQVTDLIAQVAGLEGEVVDFIHKLNKSDNNEIVPKLQEKVQKLNEQFIKMQDESVAMQKVEHELIKLKHQIRLNEFEQFLSEQISTGKLTPSQKDMGIRLFKALDNSEKFDDSDDYVEDFKQFLKTLPKQIEFDEIATKNKQKNEEKNFSQFSSASEDSIAIYNEAKQLSERDKISFKDALLKLYE